jgi:hypothetical protein
MAHAKDLCQATIDCSQRGLCSPGESDCVAGSDADCEASDACRERKLCHARAGKCAE